MKDNIFDIFCPFCGAELEETLIPQANEFEKLKAEVESLKAENTRLTAYDGGLALMPFEEWQTLSAETRARINAYGLKMETLQKELHIVLQRLVTWYDGLSDKDELFLAIDDARLALGQELK